MTVEPELTVRVAKRSREALGIDVFELVSLDGTPLPARTAGAHIDVQVPGGMVRQYSLFNDPAETCRYVIGVLEDPASRGGSKAMHAHVHEGDTLKISAPRNQFPLVEDATHSLLLAGGIGVTPLMSMAERLAACEASFELHYSSRSRERTAFCDWLAAERFEGRVHHHFDDGEPQEKLQLETLLAQTDPGTHLYVCGPKGFMDWVLSSARDAQWPEEQLHSEFFSNEVSSLGDGEFDIKIASSGEIIRVGAKQTVVAALADRGIKLQVSCEQGVCGTCLTGVLAGEPDHKDLFLMPKEQALNDQFLPCCSRARSELLVLDL